MSRYRITLGFAHYEFADLKALLAKATPLRSGDQLAGIAAQSVEERVAAQMILADLPLKAFLAEPLIPYEADEVTRLIFDEHDAAAFSAIAGLTVGEFRDWLLDNTVDSETLRQIAPGLLPEQAAAVSKLMRAQDLVKVARKIRVVTRFRTTIGLPRSLSTRLQPNHPADDARAITASITAAGVNYIMGVPGADDIMLGYQSSSFHDALYLRSVFDLRPAPEFEAWLREHRPALREMTALLEA
jgi:ethanolamine ammonia-lyase large subunit